MHIIIYTATADCNYDEFTCYNGDCEPLSFKCDGYYDCTDISDEESCGI